MRAMVDLTCPICAKPFQRTLSYVNQKKKEGVSSFKCSPECNVKYLMILNNSKPSINVLCENCGKPFLRYPSEIKNYNHHFCTRSCATSFRNHSRKRTCIYCGNKYLYDKNICTTNSCKACVEKRYKDIKNLTIKDYIHSTSVKSKHQSYKYHRIRQFAKTWNSDRPKICQYCGYDLHIEYCHIRHISSFPEDTLLSIINASDNIYILCPNHHWEFDNGYLVVGPEGLEPSTSKLRVSCSTIEL